MLVIKNISTKIILFIAFLFPILALAQVPEAGVIIPEIDSLNTSTEFCCILSPVEGFDVYDNPNGKSVGKLKRDKALNHLDRSLYSIYLLTENRKIEVAACHQVDYEIYALTFIELVDGYIKVIDTNKSYWLRLADIEKQGFKAVNWMDYLIKESGSVLGYYANDPGLRLRKGPGTDFEIITVLKDDVFEIKLTNQKEGQWCKVKVVKYREHPCDSSLSETENLEYEIEGWIKLIDDQGLPNIYNYARGC